MGGHIRHQISSAMLNTLRQFAFYNQFSQATNLLPLYAVGPLFACLQAVAFTTTRPCAIAEPSRAVDGSLSFPISQPPSRLTLLFPFSQTRIKVITGNYESVQVKVQGELPSSCGGFDIEYDGTHVALIQQQGSATESTEQKPGKRSILATIPERYCHVGVHTAGGNVDIQSVTEASLCIASCSGAVKLGKIKASSADVITEGGSVECKELTADRVGVQTQGGSITLGRLMGQHCVLDAQAADTASSEPCTSASGSVNVEVAYTESLEIKTGTGPITMGFLDTMSGSATLSSKAKGITVNGLDGTAHLESHGGPIQLKLQENLREVQAYSRGGDITCTLPPELGAISAALEPVSNVNCAQGVGFEVCIRQKAGVLHVGGSNDCFARQRSAAERQGQQQHQGLQDAETVYATHPAVRLTLNASSCDTAGRSDGQIHLAAESWLDRATAKARAKMAARSRS
ncbi:hypothetical protein WJX77_003267 [Trebouxia sp. C0004]